MAGSRHLSAILCANPLFAGLGPETIEAVAGLCVTRRLAAGETLFSKGDDGDALYAVRRGQVRIVTGTRDGRRLTLNVLGSGDVFGEIALLDGQPRTADAVAAEDSELFVVQRRDFLELLRTDSGIAIRVIEMLCARLRWTSERMEEASLLPLDMRLARRVATLADDFGTELAISQEQLAVYVGATRESVNRHLQAWRRDGIVAIGRGSLRVLDTARLAQAAGGTSSERGV